MSLAAAITKFDHITRRDFRFERFYANGKKMWQASCQFDVAIELDSKLEPVQCGQIEYRQFIRGGVWVRRGNQPWTDDNNPNGNAFFRIPAYAGQSRLADMPMHAVSGNTLSLRWKEDGEIENGQIERYGYRDTATVDTAHEKDIWMPYNSSGRSYRLRDTPSIRGEWGSGDSVEVWIELYFKGYVVEVERDASDKTIPIKILKQKSWNYFWPEKKLTQWMHATEI